MQTYNNLLKEPSSTLQCSASPNLFGHEGQELHRAHLYLVPVTGTEGTLGGTRVSITQ